MKVIIVGCGRAGAELAYRLFQQGHEVTIIDQAAEAFNNLNPTFRGQMMAGDALAEDVLRRAGIHEADALAAVTNFDSLNAVVGHVARTVFNVPKVVVRNYDARWLALHESFGLPVVSSTIWGARQTEALLFETQLHPLLSVGNGEVALYELTTPEIWQGHSIESLFPTGQGCIIAVVRAGRAMLPTPDLRLERGDTIQLSATQAGVAALRNQLAPADQ
jgi:trk system potassium uptake protein TrkA